MKKHKFFESSLFPFLSNLWDLIVLNTLFLLCCLPIITVGAALTALFSVALHMARNEGTPIVAGFFRAFRQNLKQGIIVHLIASTVSIIIGLDIYVLWKLLEVSTIFLYLMIAICLAALLHLITLFYLYPILAQFSNTVKNTIRNARFMALRHFSTTILLLLINGIPVFCALFITGALEWEILLFLLFGFALIAYVNSRLLIGIFDTYIESQPSKDPHAD